MCAGSDENQMPYRANNYCAQIDCQQGSHFESGLCVIAHGPCGTPMAAHCQSNRDKCTTDADCPDPGGYCTYSLEDKRFQCESYDEGCG